MAAYVKSGNQRVLALTEAEAQALLMVVHIGLDNQRQRPQAATAEAQNRAIRALETSCESSSRTGAAFT